VLVGSLIMILSSGHFLVFDNLIVRLSVGFEIEDRLSLLELGILASRLILGNDDGNSRLSHGLGLLSQRFLLIARWLSVLACWHVLAVVIGGVGWGCHFQLLPKGLVDS
jgi:hypothetical protein